MYNIDGANYEWQLARNALTRFDEVFGQVAEAADQSRDYSRAMRDFKIRVDQILADARVAVVAS